jgi:UDP-N-acetylmuramyl pentapeptide phosphotransferase/UDP-N-acetylglucosamine-1-phosphate transferase
MHPSLSVGLAFGISAIVTLVATPLVRAAALRFGLVDNPGPRSSHRTPTPRGGGIAIALGLAAVLAAAAPYGTRRPDTIAFMLGAFLIAAVGALDDRLGVPPRVRFAAHVVAAVVMVVGSGPLTRLPLPPPLDFPLGPVGAPLAVFWIVAVVNLYNFMDGIDGIAALHAITAGLALAWSDADPIVVLVGAAVAGSGAGFLPWNWAPARIFLGDVGSGLVGYTLAAVPFLAPPETRDKVVLLVGTSLSLFLADATLTVVRRLAKGRRWDEAHREHLYQRWANAGAGHAPVAAWIAAGSAATTLVALLAWRSGAASLGWAALLVGAMGFAFEWRVVRRIEGRAAAQV